MLESLGVGFSLVEKVQAGYQVFDNFLSFVEFLVFFYNSPEKFAASRIAFDNGRGKKNLRKLHDNEGEERSNEKNKSNKSNQ